MQNILCPHSKQIEKIDTNKTNLLFKESDRKIEIQHIIQDRYVEEKS